MDQLPETTRPAIGPGRLRAAARRPAGAQLRGIGAGIPQQRLGLFSTPVAVSDGVAPAVDPDDPDRPYSVNNFVNGFAATDTDLPCVAAWENGPTFGPRVEQSRTIELNFCTGGDAWGDSATWPNPLGLGWSVHRMGQYPSSFMAGNTLHTFWVVGQGTSQDWSEDPTLYLSSWTFA